MINTIIFFLFRKMKASTHVNCEWMKIIRKYIETKETDYTTQIIIF